MHCVFAFKTHTKGAQLLSWRSVTLVLDGSLVQNLLQVL